jgi:hypothetical protein
MDIENLIGVQAVYMAMGITNVTVEPPIRALDAFNNALLRQRFQVLIDRGVADVFALLIEAIVNFAGGEVFLLLPEQFQNEATLLAEAHSQLLTAIESVF